MTMQIWVNIGSGNGLVPCGTKPLPKSMLTNHQRLLAAFNWGKFCDWVKWMHKIHLHDMTNLRLQLSFPGSNESMIDSLKHLCYLHKQSGEQPMWMVWDFTFTFTKHFTQYLKNVLSLAWYDNREACSGVVSISLGWKSPWNGPIKVNYLLLAT